MRAYERVRRNQGNGGIDEMEVAELGNMVAKQSGQLQGRSPK